MKRCLAKALKKSAATFENEHEGIFSYTVPAIRAESALDRVFGEEQKTDIAVKLFNDILSHYAEGGRALGYSEKSKRENLILWVLSCCFIALPI